MNPLVHGHSGTAPETSWNAFGTNGGPNEDDCQSDPHLDASILRSQTTQNSGPEVGHDIVTAVHEVVTYCSPSTSSGKQKKAALPVNCNSSVRKPFRRSKQTKSCWPFSSWQTTTILQTFIIISTELPNCQNRSRQRCPRSTGKSEKLRLFEDFSKRASN